MIVRDLLNKTNDARVIARAILEDRCKLKDLYGWMTKYYAQLMSLKNAAYKVSDMMIYFSVYSEENHLYGDISGIKYDDIKEGKETCYAIEWYDYDEYASLYVPEYSIKCYGEEVVASEILREYGWNGFDTRCVCPDEMRLEILRALDDMRQELYVADSSYRRRCTEQFRKYYEEK